MQVPSKQEIADALRGTLMLARLDRGGAGLLDDSTGGFWKSFFAAVLLAPFYALFLYLAKYLETPPGTLSGVLLVEVAAYVAAWFVWPVVAFEIARGFSVRGAYRRYIVAYNWAEVWIMTVRLPVLAAIQGKILPEPLIPLAGLGTLFLVFGYRFVLARDVLGLAGMAAFGITVLELTLGLLWRVGVDTALSPYVLPPL